MFLLQSPKRDAQARDVGGEIFDVKGQGFDHDPGKAGRIRGVCRAEPDFNRVVAHGVDRQFHFLEEGRRRRGERAFRRKLLNVLAILDQFDGGIESGSSRAFSGVEWLNAHGDDAWPHAARVQHRVIQLRAQSRGVFNIGSPGNAV